MMATRYASNYNTAAVGVVTSSSSGSISRIIEKARFIVVAYSVCGKRVGIIIIISMTIERCNSASALSARPRSGSRGVATREGARGGIVIDDVGRR